MNLGDHRLGNRLDTCHNVGAHREQVVVELLGSIEHLAQVVARRKNMARSGDDDDPNGIACAYGADCLTEFGEERKAERIASLRPVEHNAGDVSGD